MALGWTLGYLLLLSLGRGEPEQVPQGAGERKDQKRCQGTQLLSACPAPGSLRMGLQVQSKAGGHWGLRGSHASQRPVSCRNWLVGWAHGHSPW